MPPEALAHDALTRLAQADADATALRLGLEGGREVVQTTLGHLRDVVAKEPRPDLALQLLHKRVVEDWPRPSPQRRAAFLTLMMARGAVRQHVPLGFDARLLGEMD